MYKNFIKRAIDVICAILALTVFSWLYLIIAVLVRINLGSPVIFKQKRPGKDERIFTLCKFRTMTDARSKDGKLLPDKERMTKFGKFLRSTSLDELPEAWNILKGDMSVVGPRPLLVDYLDHYNKEQRRRHEVRPGLTGLAQVSGRNGIEWIDILRLDTYYVDTASFLLDVKIIMKTIKKAIFREGITSTRTLSLYEALKSTDT